MLASGVDGGKSFHVVCDALLRQLYTRACYCASLGVRTPIYPGHHKRERVRTNTKGCVHAHTDAHLRTNARARAHAFHKVAPSLPGFGFSESAKTPNADAAFLARAIDALMVRLGYVVRTCALPTLCALLTHLPSTISSSSRGLTTRLPVAVRAVPLRWYCCDARAIIEIFITGSTDAILSPHTVHFHNPG